MALKRATKEQSKLRLAIYGLSGGGKTYSALSIAEGLVDVFGGKIAVLDTEFRSASKYANIFNFETDDFGEPTIDNYLAFIEMCKQDPEITVLIIDSLTHAWQWCLTEVDRLTKGSGKGDNRNAWRVVSPKYDRLVNAIITAPFHVIGTMRAKTEWSAANESKASRRDTLAPVQREGFEYEFDMLMEINANHFGVIIKDRSGKFQDEVIEKPGFPLGVKLAEWLKDGIVPAGKPVGTTLQPQTPPAAPPSEGAPPPPPAEKTFRQQIINEIAVTLKAVSQDQTEFFTDAERKTVRKQIQGTSENDALMEIAEKWNKELQKRAAEYEPIPFDDTTSEQAAPASTQETSLAPKNDKQTLSNELREMMRKKHEEQQATGATQKTTTATPAGAADDGFVDDIPGEEEQVQAMYEEPEAELVGAEASDVLDIF